MAIQTMFTKKKRGGGGGGGYKNFGHFVISLNKWEGLGSGGFYNVWVILCSVLQGILLLY